MQVPKDISFCALDYFLESMNDLVCAKKMQIP